MASLKGMAATVGINPTALSRILLVAALHAIGQQGSIRLPITFQVVGESVSRGAYLLNESPKKARK